MKGILLFITAFCAIEIDSENVENIIDDDFKSAFGDLSMTDIPENLSDMAAFEPTTYKVVVRLKKSETIDDVLKDKKFELNEKKTIGKKVFFVLKLKRPDEIIVESTTEDPDVKSLKDDPRVLSVKVLSFFNFKVSAVDPTEIADKKFWYLNGKYTPSQRIPDAWALGYSGKGVIVAVVDQYLDTNHTDLVRNIRTDIDYDFWNNDDDPKPENADFSHGTAVAGMIVSEAGNNICTVGVAYEAKVVGLNIFKDHGISVSDHYFSSIFSHKKDIIAIYSNSWGPGSPFGFYPIGEMTEAVLEEGSKLGRDGKGNIYVFAAGNFNARDNTNAFGFCSSIYTIAISSATLNGPASYAQVGSSIMVVAYGGDVGISVQGVIVPVPFSECRTGYTGTSFACPVVSGAIALALEANSNLTWRCVQSLLVRTSKRHTLVDLIPDYNWQTNGAGYQTHPRMGFGLIDVGSMVTMAKNWKPVPLQRICKIERSRILKSTESVMANDSFLVKCKKRLTIGTNCQKIQFLEHVLVSVAFQYSGYRGSVEIYLYSPSGTKAYLLTPRVADALKHRNSGYLTWTFKSLQTWGENPCGRWRLEFRSIMRKITVTVTKWSLTLYGVQYDSNKLGPYSDGSQRTAQRRPGGKDVDGTQYSIHVAVAAILCSR